MRRQGERLETAPRVKGSNPVTQKVAYLKCPECDAYMRRRNFRKASGVIIDSCRKHGTWLDADELEQITGFVLSGGNPKAQQLMEDADRGAAQAVKRMRMAEFEHTGRSMSYGGGGLFGRTIAGVLRGLLD